MKPKCGTILLIAAVFLVALHGGSLLISGGDGEKAANILRPAYVALVLLIVAGPIGLSMRRNRPAARAEEHSGARQGMSGNTIFGIGILFVLFVAGAFSAGSKNPQFDIPDTKAVSAHSELSDCIRVINRISGYSLSADTDCPANSLGWKNIFEAAVNGTGNGKDENYWVGYLTSCLVVGDMDNPVPSYEAFDICWVEYKTAEENHVYERLIVEETWIFFIPFLIYIAPLIVYTLKPKIRPIVVELLSIPTVYFVYMLGAIGLFGFDQIDTDNLTAIYSVIGTTGSIAIVTSGYVVTWFIRFFATAAKGSEGRGSRATFRAFMIVFQAVGVNGIGFFLIAQEANKAVIQDASLTATQAIWATQMVLVLVEKGFDTVLTFFDWVRSGFK